MMGATHGAPDARDPTAPANPGERRAPPGRRHESPPAATPIPFPEGFMVWQWFARRWLHDQAASAVRDAVKSGRGQAREQTDASRSAEQQRRDCDVGVLFALNIEAGGLIDRTEGVVTTRGDGFVAHEGKLGDASVVIFCTGAGCDAAARATRALIEGHRPKWVISTGFAGGLRDEVKRGDFLLADHVCDPQGRSLAIDLKMDAGAVARQSNLHLGRLLSTKRVIDRPQEKRELGVAHDAVAVDMETFAVADVCRKYKTRCISVRIVTDAVDDKLPRDVDHLVKQKSLAGRIGAATGAVFRRPSSVKDMFRLKEDALVASDKLAVFLGDMIRQLRDA
jgi:adenosylhomocysteine nucleosidase